MQYTVSPEVSILALSWINDQLRQEVSRRRPKPRTTWQPIRINQFTRHLLASLSWLVAVPWPSGLMVRG